MYLNRCELVFNRIIHFMSRTFNASYTIMRPLNYIFQEMLILFEKQITLLSVVSYAIQKYSVGH